MSNHSERETEKEEKRSMEKTRKEKLAEYFFSLSNTILGSLIIGVALLLFENQNDYNWWIVVLVLITGFAFLIGLTVEGPLSHQSL